MPVYGAVPPDAATVRVVVLPLQLIVPAVAVATNGAIGGGGVVVIYSNIPASGFPLIPFPIKSCVKPTLVPKFMATELANKL